MVVLGMALLGTLVGLWAWYISRSSDNYSSVSSEESEEAEEEDKNKYKPINQESIQ